MSSNMVPYSLHASFIQDLVEPVVHALAQLGVKKQGLPTATNTLDSLVPLLLHRTMSLNKELKQPRA